MTTDRTPSAASYLDCPRCHGASTVDPDPLCPFCGGEGQIEDPGPNPTAARGRGRGASRLTATLRPHTCVCGEINTRHCPVHGQGGTGAASGYEFSFQIFDVTAEEAEALFDATATFVHGRSDQVFGIGASPIADETEDELTRKKRRCVKLLPWLYCRACGNRLALREFAARWYMNGLDDGCFRTVCGD